MRAISTLPRSSLTCSHEAALVRTCNAAALANGGATTGSVIVAAADAAGSIACGTGRATGACDAGASTAGGAAGGTAGCAAGCDAGGALGAAGSRVNTPGGSRKTTSAAISSSAVPHTTGEASTAQSRGSWRPGRSRKGSFSPLATCSRPLGRGCGRRDSTGSASTFSTRHMVCASARVKVASGSSS